MEHTVQGLLALYHMLGPGKRTKKKQENYVFFLNYYFIQIQTVFVAVTMLRCMRISRFRRNDSDVNI